MVNLSVALLRVEVFVFIQIVYATNLQLRDIVRQKMSILCKGIVRKLFYI